MLTARTVFSGVCCLLTEMEKENTLKISRRMLINSSSKDILTWENLFCEKEPRCMSLYCLL